MRRARHIHQHLDAARVAIREATSDENNARLQAEATGKALEHLEEALRALYTEVKEAPPPRPSFVPGYPR